MYLLTKQNQKKSNKFLLKELKMAKKFSRYKKKRLRRRNI
ncbi:MAG: hypothetical protein BAJALOKI3v1_720019 [Promethearchaeota archaeon]|nr:MAG: hypothetical protein BAJALOKI3v1_720019 [Candidatus Lokiarchaeota archaeon]